MTATFTLAEVHDAEFESRAHRLMDADVAELRKQSGFFVEHPCPACGGAARHPAFSHNELRYVRCAACETLFISPGPTNEQCIEFARNSRGLACWREEMPAHVRKSRQSMYRDRADYVRERLVEFGVAPARVLEIGAGNGELAELLLADRSLRIDAYSVIEPQPFDLADDRIVLRPSLRALEAAGGAFDLVLMFEVLEHIPAPEDLLSAVVAMLRPRGLFILSTPNANSYETRMLGRNSLNVPFDHVALYNPGSLELRLRRSGFDALRIETPGRLDVEALKRAYEDGALDLGRDAALRFLLEDGYEFQDRFQAFLRRNLLSGHMRAIARPASACR